MNKKIMNTIVGVGAFAVVASSLGTIGWYVTEAILNGNYEHEIITNYDVLIPEYDVHYTQQSREDGKFILDDEMLAKFKTRVLETLGHGPELASLKSIYFATEEKIIDDGTQGYFIPGTNMIVLNIELLYLKWINSRDNTNWKEEDFIEIIFQVFTHEYGHHIAYEYFNTYSFTEHISDITTEIYDGSGFGRSRSNWSKTFIDEFKSILNYDKDIVLETGNGGWKDRSIREVYDARDLFEIANGANTPTYDQLNNFGFEVYWTSTTLKGDDKLNIGVWDGIESEYESLILDYYYSMQELFTRKLMQITYDIDYSELTSSLKPTSTKANGSLVTVNGNTWSTYWNDFATYTSYEKQTDSLQPYLADNPFSTVDSSKDLFDLYSKVTGQYGGADISYISSRAYLVEDIDIEGGTITKDVEKWESSTKELTMGGWVTQEYDEVRLYDINENNQVINDSFDSYKMMINDSISMYKEDHTTESVSTESDDNYDKYSWLLANENSDGELSVAYVNNSKFENKVIAFVDGTGENESIKWDLSIKEDANYGFTSNWRDQTITSIGDDNIFDVDGYAYHLKLNDNNMAIVKKGIYA